jgi:RimJ/RimL family protein N-acetyltransferase
MAGGALPLSDGAITLRPMREGDAAILMTGRDAVFHRFMGEGSPDPHPTAVIELDGGVVGWVDHDHDEIRTWLAPHECNIGYHVFAAHRGQGLAQAGVRLLLELLAAEGRYQVATFLVDAENAPSLRVAEAVGAVERERLTFDDGRPQVLLVRPIR